MPQLDPTPWLMILAFTWIVLIMILPLKVLAHITPNKLTRQNAQKPKMEYWYWPW